MKFKEGQEVVHVKTGKVYRVLYTPRMAKLEQSGAPCYVYRNVDQNEVWCRSQSEMEDGRFEGVVYVHSD